MSSVPGSSSAITPFSKQRAYVVPVNGNSGKLKQLKRMIEELEKERIQYIKTNQHLTQNAELIYQQNKVLKDAINDRVIHYEHILDQYSHSTKTLQTATENNKKMSKIYHGYENRVRNAKKIDDDSVFGNREIEKFEQEIKDIQKAADELIKKFYDSEKEIFDYKVLLSLDSRLTKINRLLSNEAKNCISKNTHSTSLNKLQQKVTKGDEIKKELSINDSPKEKQKIEETEYALKIFSEKLDRCLTIYNQILQINKKRCLMSDDDLESSSSFSENSKSNKKKKNEKVSFENAESKVPEKIGLDDEIDELRRIVGSGDYDYLCNIEREENDRKIKSLFIPGFNNEIYDSEESTESEESEKENYSQKFLDHKNKDEKEKSLISERSSKSKQKENNDKHDKSRDLIQTEKVDTHKKTDHQRKENKSEKNETILQEKKSEKSKKQEKVNNSDVEKENNNKHSNKAKKNEKDDKINKKSELEQSEQFNNHEKTDPLVKVNKPNKEEIITVQQEEEKSEKSNKTKQTKNNKQSELSQPGKVKNHAKTDHLVNENKPRKEEILMPQQEDEQSEKSNKTKQTKKDEIVDEKIDKQSELSQPEKVKNHENTDNLNKENKPEKEETLTSQKEDDQSEKSNKFMKSDNNEAVEKSEKEYAPLVHRNKRRKQLKKRQIQRNSQQEEQESNFLLENKATNTEKVEQPQSSAESPYSLLVHPIKKRQKLGNKVNKENTEEEILSEYQLNEKEEQSEISTNAETSNHSDQPKSKQLEKSEPKQSPTNSPYSLLVHPIKKRQKLDNKVNKDFTEEDILSEYQLNELEEQSEIVKSTETSNHSDQPKSDSKSKQPEKSEPKQPPTNSPYSLLVHPNRNKKQSSTTCNQKNNDESEFASEFLLAEDQSVVQTTSENQDISNDSEKPIYTCQPNSTQTNNAELSKSTVDKPYSLLVHPNKNKQQKSNTVNQKPVEESEYASEFILDSNKDDETEKSIATDKFDLSSDQAQQDKELSQTEKHEISKSTYDKPYSLLVHPDKNRKQKSTAMNTRPTEESEYASEFILDSNKDDETEKSIATDKFNLSSDQIEQNIKPSQTKKEESPKSSQTNNAKLSKSTVDKPYSLLVHPNRNNQQKSNTVNQKQVEESEYASEFILDSNKYDETEKSIDTDKFDLSSDQTQQDIKPSQTEKDEISKSTYDKPYSLLVHPDKNRKQISNITNKRPIEESEYASEYILDSNKDETEKSIDTDEFNLSSDQIEHNKKLSQTKKEEIPKITQTDKVELSKSTVDKPYSLLVHPNRNKQQKSNTVNQKSVEESEYASEFILESNKYEETEKSIDTDKFDLSSDQTKQDKELSQTEKHELSKSTYDKPYSLLVHSDKNRKQKSTTTNARPTEESEYASEYILDSNKDETEKSIDTDKLDLSSDQTQQDIELLQTEKHEISKSTYDKPYSLLVHPDKNRKQKSTAMNTRPTEESEYASEFILDGLEEPSEQFNMSLQQENSSNTKKSIISSQSNEIQKSTTEKPYSLLVHPDKNRKKKSTITNQKALEESEYASEYIIDNFDVSQSEKAIVSDNFNLSSDEEKEELPKTEKSESKSTNDKPYSLLVHPDKSKQQKSTTINQKASEESEYISEYILDEFEALSEIFNRSTHKANEFLKSTQPEKVEIFKSNSDKPYSLLVHPDKNRKQKPTTINQRATEESEYASEYILDSNKDDETEKAIVTDKFILSSDQIEQNIKQSKTKKEEKSKSTVNNPYSLLVHPNKSKQHQFVMNNQKTTEESEYASEYILDSLEGNQSEKATVTDKFILSNNQKQQNIKPSQTKKEESSKQSDKAAYSLLVHPNKSKQKRITVNNQRVSEEELISEYILDGFEANQSENNTATDHEQQKVKQNEKEKSLKSPVNYSLLINQNKIRKQSFTINNQRISDEEYASEYVLNGTKDDQSEQSDKSESNEFSSSSENLISQSNELKNKENTKSPVKLPCSHQLHPNKSRRQMFFKSQEESEQASEYVLDGTKENESEQLNKSDCLEFASSSEKSIYSSQSNEFSKLKQKEESPTQKPYSLLVHPNKNKQQSFIINNQIKPEESEQQSEYILDENDKSESEKAVVTEKFILSNSQQNIKSNQADKASKLPVKLPCSLLVHPNKGRQQSFINNNQKSSEETEEASDYILGSNDDTESDKVIVTEKFLLNNSQSQQNTKSNQTKENIQSQKPNNASCSLLVKPQKKRQQLKNQCDSKITSESSNASELILEELEDIEDLEEQLEEELQKEEEITHQFERSMKSNQTEKSSNSPVKPPCSLLVHPNKGRQQSFINNNQKSSEETEEASDYILGSNDDTESDKVIVTEKFLLTNSQSQQNTKPNQTEKASNSPVKPPCSLLVHPNKSRQQSFINNNSKSSEETLDTEEASDFILGSNDDTESDKVIVTEKFLLTNSQSQQNTKSNQTKENIEPLKPTNSSRSLLVNPSKNRQKPVSFHCQKDSNEDEFDSEFLLEGSESDSDKPKKETENLKSQNSVKKTVVCSPTKQKKKPFKSTYDPRIFYSSFESVPSNTLDFQDGNDHVALTVTLKDIGLEGLDSSNLEKMKELQKLKQEEKKKNKSKIVVRVDEFGDKKRQKIEAISKSEVVCKLSTYDKKEKLCSSRKKDNQFEPYVVLSLSSDEQKNSTKNSKPTSLLNSTQKAQKTQAIKPKTHPKTCSKMNKTNSVGCKCQDESKLKKIVYRSPRRFNEVKSDSDESKDSLLC